METTISPKQLLREAFDTSTTGKIFKYIELAIICGIGGYLLSSLCISLTVQASEEIVDRLRIGMTIFVLLYAFIFANIMPPGTIVAYRFFRPSPETIQDYADKEMARLDTLIEETEEAIQIRQERIIEYKEKQKALLIL